MRENIWIILQIHTINDRYTHKVKGHILQTKRPCTLDQKDSFSYQPPFWPLSQTATSQSAGVELLKGCTTPPQTLRHPITGEDVICQALEMLIEFRLMKTHFPPSQRVCIHKLHLVSNRLRKGLSLCKLERLNTAHWQPQMRYTITRVCSKVDCLRN